MAIIVGQEEKRINWMAVSIALIVLTFLLISTYYLFFYPTPLIEQIIPPQIKMVSDISEITIDAKSIREILDNPVYRSLKPYVSSPTPGLTGRANPFLPF